MTRLPSLTRTVGRDKELMGLEFIQLWWNVEERRDAAEYREAEE